MDHRGPRTSMAVGTEGTPNRSYWSVSNQHVVSAGDAAIQRRRLPLYSVLPLRIGALWFLGARIGRQRQKRGRNCYSDNGG